MRMSHIKIALCLTASIVAICAVPMILVAKPISYQLPEETAAFGPGPNQDTVLGNCTACHSSDYIKTQPQGAAFKKDFWQAEVTKMIKVYGAPIDDADVGKIVDYLAATH
jgi:sulfite dehydrogenase (cytochrome) subunit B